MRSRWRVWTLGFVVSMCWPPALGASSAFNEVRTVLAECQAAYYRLVDYRGIVHREVWNGRSTPHLDDIAVVFRKPAFLRLEWQTGLYRGTTLLGRPGWNQGSFLLTLGNWFEFISVNLPPTDSSAPFVPGLKDIHEWLTALAALARRPASDRSLQLVQVQTRGPRVTEGHVLLSVPAFLIPFQDNSVATYEFLIERGTGIPDTLVLRDTRGMVRQRLSYTELHVNAGVSVQDFGEAGGADVAPSLVWEKTEIDLRRFIQNWQRRYGEIRDYTGRWITQEYTGDQLREKQATFKFRQPFDVYLEWNTEGQGVRQALFRQGWNRGRVRVRTSVWGIPLIGDLAPDAYLVRRGVAYPITEFGLHRLVARLETQLLQGWLQDELEVRFLGVQEFEERPCYVLEFVFPNSQWRIYPHSRVVTYWDIRRRVPVRHETFDWSNRLEDRQEFRHLELNVSLNDTDFDATNPAYGFLLFRRTPRLDWFLTGRE